MKPTRRRWGPLAAVAVLVGVLALTAVAMPSAPVPRPAMRETTRPGEVWSIALPDAAPTLPDRPHREQFQAYCRLCHSPRLALTQPRLSQEAWRKVVKKMATVYKAPIPADQEAAIVEYLLAVQGPP